MTEWRYSQLTFTERNSCLQACLLQPERVSEIHFLAIQRPKFQKIFPLLSTLGIPHGDSELSKL